MKPLREYDRHDWLRLRPLNHWFKIWRRNAERDAFNRLPARAGDLADATTRIRGRRVLTTMAFDDPDATGMQLPLVARFVPDAVHVVADISMDEAAASENAAIAACNNVAYLRLPANPLQRPEQASRTHGLAVNWVWHNLIRPGEPEVFGFLDDDFFPTAPDDPFAALDRQPVYGLIRHMGPRWFLSANFSMYRFEDVRDLPLDFGQDWFKGLDTGGGNWEVLFRRLDHTKMEFVVERWVPYKPGADVKIAPIVWCGAWLHEVGSTRRNGYIDLAVDKRQTVRDLLAPHLAT